MRKNNRYKDPVRAYVIAILQFILQVGKIIFMLFVMYVFYKYFLI